MSNSSSNSVSLKPAGRLRQGFHYQDLLLIECLVQWLSDEDRYRWVKAEADDGGFLDDVQIMRGDDVLELWQVKFSVNPNEADDPWTWDDLLQRERGKRGPKDSLLQKWYKTWSKAKESQQVEASLVSNRRASPELEACLSQRTELSRTVQWNDIALPVRTTIVEQLNGETNARQFLSEFRWRLDEPQLNELEQSVLSRFERMGGTRGNWEPLWRVARNWIERKNDPAPDGRILLESVRSSAGFRRRPVRLHTFLPASAFFQHYTEEGRLFHHRSPLVGRRLELGRMVGFASDTKHRIAVLSGRGGNGKSRLIAALCRRLWKRNPDLPVRIVAENVKVTEAALEELPDERCLIIVDDAHRSDSLNLILGAARQNPGIQLLLVARPHAADLLFTQVRESGFDSTQLLYFEPLQDLSAQQMRRLARTVLGREYVHLIDELALVTRDCPLLTILGGQLLRKHQIAPSILKSNNTFRREVLGRLLDKTLAKALNQMDGRFSKELCDRVLPYIAVTTPLDCTHTRLLEKIASKINTDVPTLASLLDALVAGGMLVRGGRYIRLVPDVLSDYILQEACFTVTGCSKGWADEAFQLLREVCPDNVLRNLAELDWRIRTAPENENDKFVSYGDGAALLSGIWRNIEAEFKAGTLAQRRASLGQMERLAFTQPESLWRLVEMAHDDPKVELVEETKPNLRRYHSPVTQRSVMTAAIPLLKSIARHERFTRRCCDVLWELARDFQIERPNDRPEAMDALKEIASYQSRKPLVFQEMILACCRRWLNDPKIHDYPHSILFVIACILERVPGPSYTNERFIAVNSDNSPERWWASFWRLREGALDLVERCLKSEHPDVVLRAIECLKKPVSEEGLYPLNKSTDEEDKEDRQRWEVEQLRAIAIVREIALSNEDPFVRLTVQEALGQQMRGPRPSVRERAREAFEAIPETFHMRLVRVYAQSRHCTIGNRWDETEEEDQRCGEDTSQLCAQVVKEFVIHYPTPQDGFEALDEWRQRIEMSLWWKGTNPGLWRGMWTRSNDFLLRLTLDFPNYALGICQVALEHSEQIAVSTCSDILVELRRRDVKLAAEMASRFIETGHPNLCMEVAESYSWRGWPLKPDVQDWEAIENLLQFPHPVVKRSAVEVLSSIAKTEPRRAIEMAMTVDPCDDLKVADTLFGCFDIKWGFDFELITEDERLLLLLRIEHLRDVSSSHIGRFLLQFMLREPMPVVLMLTRRIERKRRSYWELDEKSADDDASILSSREHTVLPEHGFRDEALAAITSHPDYITVLRAVRDYSLVRPGLSYRDNAAELFHILSFGWNETSLSVINEWVNSGDDEKICYAADLLENTSIAFYSSHVPFVANFLERAFECGPEVRESVESSLSRYAIHGPSRLVASRRGERSHALVDSVRLVLEDKNLDEFTRRFFKNIEVEGHQMLRRETEEREAESVFFHR